MAFPILSGKEWKSWSTASTSCSLAMNDIRTLGAFYAKTVEQNTLWPL
jgi:hypothetical protein